MDISDDLHDWNIEAIAIGEPVPVENTTTFMKRSLELSIRSPQNEGNVLRFDGVGRFIINEVSWQNVILRFVVIDDTTDPVYQEKKQLLEGLWHLKNADSPRRIAFIESSTGAEGTIEFAELSVIPARQ